MRLFASFEKQYLVARHQLLNRLAQKKRKFDLDVVWDGGGKNDNAALTVFRHFDSATVIKGLHGKQPKTAWLISYPILERLHYLLVAGYDVFGNVGHQFNTRVYMDFLRMESEMFFLAFLPEEVKQQQWQYMYRQASAEVQSYINGEWAQMPIKADIPYQTSEPLKELYAMLKNRMSPVLDERFSINTEQIPQQHHDALGYIDKIKGLPASVLPEFSLLTIYDKNNQPHLYSVLRDSGHSNIATLLREESNRLPFEDDMTVLRGVIGAYPNALWRVNEYELDEFVSTLENIRGETGYRQFLDKYGVRRTAKDFWQYSDQVHKAYQVSQPEDFGLLDYNRLENR